MRLRIREETACLLVGATLGGVVIACDQLTADHPVAADVESVRRAACSVASMKYWQTREPRLKTVHELCVQGAELEVIAAAFAGCAKEAMEKVEDP